MFFAIVCATQASPVDADGVRKLATEPRRGSNIGGAHSLARLDFYYGDIRAWLLQDGNWHIEGSIRHRGALCGTYQLGIQFGKDRSAADAFDQISCAQRLINCSGNCK